MESFTPTDHDSVEATINGRDWDFYVFAFTHNGRHFCYETREHGKNQTFIEVQSIKKPRRILTRREAEKEFGVKIIGN